MNRIVDDHQAGRDAEMLAAELDAHDDLLRDPAWDEISGNSQTPMERK